MERSLEIARRPTTAGSRTIREGILKDPFAKPKHETSSSHEPDFLHGPLE